ncbi:TonB-dependent siderophore receptor [Azovibrio restrictus]|uniref:TonB-dependent receptor plug domain-containing protein n=1 Tax=Azovibrio restrictus TaxID=146938 RepID=UPI0026F36639|nr:TonB-dependent receptor [Azovibrio restrictus]
MTCHFNPRRRLCPLPYLLPALLASPLNPAQAADGALAEVIVTDQREAQIARKDAAIQKITISETEVERYGDATVGDVLRRLPGMTFTGPAGVTKDVRMRGLDKGYTQFLINGEPIPSAKKERQIQVDRLPADMIERIEIIRNPGAIHDANGIGGTINIVLKQRVDNSTRLRAAYGKNGKLDVGDVVAQWSGSFNNLDVLLAASHTVGAEDIREEKYKLKADGTIDNKETKGRPVKKDETLLAPRLIWKIGTDRLTIDPFISKGSERKNEPNTITKGTGALDKTTHKKEDKHDDVSRLAARYDGKAAWGEWHVKAAVQEAKESKKALTREWKANGSLNKTTDENEELKEQNSYAGAGISLPLGPHLIQTGVEWRDTAYRNSKTKIENGADKSDAKDDFKIDEKTFIFYLQDEWRLAEKHWITPGVRLEKVEREARDNTNLSRNTQLSGTNPSLHYRWALLDDLNLRASAARTQRLPKYDELNPYEKLEAGVWKGGNPGLKPETATGYELGLEKFFWGKRGVAGLNFYERNVDDFIQKETRMEGVKTVERPYNVGKAHFYGVELDWRIPLIQRGPHELTLTGNHAEMRGRVDVKNVGTGAVKDLPPRSTNLGLDWRHKPSKWSAGFNVNHQPTFTTRALDVNGDAEYKTRQAATLLDLYVGKILSPTTELRLIAKNVLSVEKEERTIKYKADGSFSSGEKKTEFSEPTVFMTLETRF